MKKGRLLLVLAASPLLVASIWMDDQPSYKPYEAPVLAPPATAVPVTGKETVTRDSKPRNPVAPSGGSVARGKALFEVNCAMCHGMTSAGPGRVGMKLKPPPPGLDAGMVKGLSDADIFKAVTFGFGRMPPFRPHIAPRDRWDLVNFLRTRK